MNHKKGLASGSFTFSKLFSGGSEVMCALQLVTGVPNIVYSATPRPFLLPILSRNGTRLNYSIRKSKPTSQQTRKTSTVLSRRNKMRWLGKCPTHSGVLRELCLVLRQPGRPHSPRPKTSRSSWINPNPHEKQTWTLADTSISPLYITHACILLLLHIQGLQTSWPYSLTNAIEYIRCYHQTVSARRSATC